MRFGINSLFLLPGRVGGTEIYTQSLLEAMSRSGRGHRLVLFTNRENHDSLVRPGDGIRRVRCPVPASVRPYRIAWEQLALPVQIRRQRLDALFSPGFTTPLASGVPAVVVCYDLIWKTHPANFPRSYRLFLETLIPLSARRASAVVTLSRHTRDEVCRRFRIPPSKVVAVPAAPGSWIGRLPAPPDQTGDDRRRDRLGVRSPYLLTVSTLAPHKNVARLVEAFAGLAARPDPGKEALREPLQLVLAGIKGRAHAETLATVRAHGLGEHDVVITGWVDDADLAALYRGARLFVYPSLHEGFGMPVLEAMAFGVPVACSSTTSLPEVGGDDAAYFDPADTGDMTRVIAAALADPDRTDRAARGRARSARFTWDAAADRVLDLLERAAGGRA